MAGALLFSGCIGGSFQQETNATPATVKTGTNPFPGSWQYFGFVGPHKVAIQLTFLGNGTGRFELVAPDEQTPLMQSMDLTWESRDDRLWIGSESEKQHLDIRYRAEDDRLLVKADETSGLFIGEDFVPGPFSWEFSRAQG
ncbi:MAG: hypothetical protein NQU46_04805 [Methanolinea sp.]|nr:hypothetical protein [Methanolinea sp.]